MLVTHGGIIDFFSRPLLAPAGGNGRDGPINEETSFAHESHLENGPALFISTSHVAEHHRSSPNPFTIFTSATPVYTCHTPQERQHLGVYPSTVSHPLILCSIAWFVFLEGCPSETLELSKLREVDTPSNIHGYAQKGECVKDDNLLVLISFRALRPQPRASTRVTDREARI